MLQVKRLDPHGQAEGTQRPHLRWSMPRAPSRAFARIPNCWYAIADTINDRGDVYGVCNDRNSNNAPEIARFSPGSPHRVNGPSGETSPIAEGFLENVNSSGTFVYSAYARPEDSVAAFGKDVSAAALLPQYATSEATWINDAGTVVGSFSTTWPFSPQSAYVYPAGGPLKVLPQVDNATRMEAAGINKYGTIVGTWCNTNNSTCGIFLYRFGVMSDITQSIPITANNVYPGLSDSGQFVVSTATEQKYVISPVGP